jgi:CIC family chloride channel protein
MIFEMTLDYSIVMPMIVAVAMSIGVRRVLSRETIYTMKLVRRGRTIPNARHANMFLVRAAREVVDTDIQCCQRTRALMTTCVSPSMLDACATSW